MFGLEKVAALEEEVANLESQVEDLEDVVAAKAAENARLLDDHNMEIKNLNADHEIDLKKAKAETENAVLEAKNAAMKEIVETQKENAVLKERDDIWAKMLDLNADVLDVKDLVNKLIGALPKVNITGSLSAKAVNGNDNSSS